MEELRYVTRTYNKVLFDNREIREKLSHEASHDALTGLLNRGAYDLLMEDTDREHMALIIIDVDHFKIINDTYGHAVGDRILKKVADLIQIGASEENRNKKGRRDKPKNGTALPGEISKAHNGPLFPVESPGF